MILPLTFLRRRLGGGLLFALVLSVLIWGLLLLREPFFQGLPESYWIANISYADEQEINRWRAFGSAGIRVLVRGLKAQNRPLERAYRKAYRQLARILPDRAQRLLPARRKNRRAVCV